MTTTKPQISQIREHSAKRRPFMNFGDELVPMCAGCGAVRVDEKGKRCAPCVRVLVNQQKADAEHAQAMRQLKFLCVGILVFLAMAGASWVWLAN